MDLADEVETVADAVGTIRQWLEDARFVVPPTALHKLALSVRDGETERIRKTALRALSQLRAWGFELLNLVPVGHGIVERIAEESGSSSLLGVRALLSAGSEHIVASHERMRFHE